MQINKAQLSGMGDNLRISVPFTKVDKDKRIVRGFATTDALDKRDDLVLSSASEKAFKRFRGNIREMHAPIAVGKMVSCEPQEVYDHETGQFYKGIFVEVYVSKGAQDTWEKVLDETLTGFSIGGEIVDAEPHHDPETGKTVRIIKDYDLVELSLVDSPCNQLSNVLSFVKADGITTLEGMAVEAKASNVFWCNAEQIAKVSDDEATACGCGEQMQVIGWIDTSGSEKALAVKEVVNKFLGSEEPSTENNEGGNEVADNEVVEETPEVVETAEVEETPVVEETPETPVINKAAEVSEVEVEEEQTPATPDLGAFMDQVNSLIKSAFAENTDAMTAVFDDIRSSVKALEESQTELAGKFEKSVSGANEQIVTLAGAVEKIDAGTALKKSDDLGGSEAIVNKNDNVWDGSFLNADSLN